jgi:aspartate carbamoyltransferase catalytic subunit
MESLNYFNHLIDLDRFTADELAEIVNLTKAIKQTPATYKGACVGRIMGTLFYEPSTRTQMSFQSAMLRLGGGIIGFSNPETSSVKKGESLKDTIKMVSGYSDVLVIRAPWEGTAAAAALYADCVVINAGDGGHLHPTQTLTDITTLMCELGRLSHLTIGICGDLKYGRTVHSLVKTLSKYPGNRFVFISDDSHRMPEHITAGIAGLNYHECDNLEDALPELEVLYMTRLQKERFAPGEQAKTIILNKENLKLASDRMPILHPLPRNEEIAVEVDDDPRAMYFKQANYGMYARMALILSLLNMKYDFRPILTGEQQSEPCCPNSKCITNIERYMPKSYRRVGNTYECEYCEARFSVS